jgi:hypothetical protein
MKKGCSLGTALIGNDYSVWKSMQITIPWLERPLWGGLHGPFVGNLS